MALPDFVVAGVARAGTTTLYNLLKNHNQIYLPKIKETNFFSDVKSKDKDDYILPKDDKEYHTKIIKDWSTYLNLFKNARANEQLTGDISPSYMWDHNSAKRIKNKNDNAKIIITLRSPVERTISHYKMNYYIGHESEKNFLKAIDKKDDGFWGGGNCYLRCSFYYDALKSFYDNFGVSNILVIIHEDWITNQIETLNRITEFLEIKDFSNNYYTYTHDNEINSLKNKRLLNLLRNNFFKSVLKNIFSEDQLQKVKKNIFEGDKMEVCISKDNKKSLKKLFYEDVIKTSELIGIDLTKKWKFNLETHN
jgi:hypothetical protein